MQGPVTGGIGAITGRAGASSGGVGNISGGIGSSSSTGSSVGSGIGSSTGTRGIGNIGGGGGMIAPSTPGAVSPPPSSMGSVQGYVDQAELARCNGLVGASRDQCLGSLRQRMDSGIGARAMPGGRIGSTPGAPGTSQTRPPVAVPGAPGAPTPPLGPGSGGLFQGPVTNPIAPAVPGGR